MVLFEISSFLSTSSALLLFNAFHFCHSFMDGAFILIVAVDLALVLFLLFYLDSLAFPGLSVLCSFPSLSVGFTLNLYHPLLYSTCFVVEFVVRSFYLLYFTFCVGQ